MPLSIKSVVFAVCAVSATLRRADAQELSLDTLAVKIPEAAVAAVDFRDDGKPKEFLTKPLPPKGSSNNRTAREMHQVVDDVYAFPDLKSLTYFTYTRERFLQELQGKTAPVRFEQVSAQVLACQVPVTSTEWSDLNYCLTFKKSSNCTEQPKWQSLMQCVASAVRAYGLEK